MTKEEASALACQHLGTERVPHQVEQAAYPERKIWNVSFAGDGEPPVIVSVDGEKREVIQVFEPLKMMGGPMGQVRDIITEIPEGFKTES
jgi:hypothetical protein